MAELYITQNTADYRKWLSQAANDLPLFFQAWWLDAVAGPDTWSVLLAQDANQQTQAVWPFVQSRKWGFTYQSPPPFSPGLGPRLVSTPPSSKLHRLRDWEWKIWTALLKELPESQVYVTKTAYDFPNALPFIRQGWNIHARYSYVFPEVEQSKAIWEGLAGRTRTTIRKASDQLQLQTEWQPDLLWRLCQRSYQHRAARLDFSAGLINRMVAAVRDQQRGIQLTARDARGRPHASLLLVWDRRSAYNLLQGSDPALRDSGANAWLLWEAIQRQVGTGRAFDFEGSQLPGVEAFFRSFGAPLRTYYQMEWVHPWIRPLWSLRR